jgi:hypothetical protein
VPNPLPNVELTENFLQEHVQEFFGVSDIADLDEAFRQYMGRVEEVAGPRGENLSVFSWDDVNSIAQEISPADTRLEVRRRRFALKAGSLTLGIGLDLDRSIADQDPSSVTSKQVRTTGEGTFILVDAQGNVKAGLSDPNEEVDSSYGDPTPYVLEKLGWAKLIELTIRQGADWGFGYEVLTEYLRSINRIDATALPHVGMATAHEIKFSDETQGQDRNALAYASASNYTLTRASIGQLLKDPRFFALYEKDLNRGLFTNISDWVAGRLDSLVARRACQIYLGKEVSTDFPYLDEPDYIDVDNN